MQIQIILPATDEGAMSAFLRGLTKAIYDATGDDGGYGLGGAHGYGANWNSAVFMMKPYCWCERTDCAWCAGCDCPDPCSYHGADVHQDVGFVPERGAPNFWHKPSGLKVWWYKYIGRGMEIVGDGDLALISADCARDIAQGTSGSAQDPQGAGPVPNGDAT